MTEMYDINGNIINRDEGGGGIFTFIGILFKLVGFLILLGISFCVIVCTGGIGLVIVIPVFYFIFKK